MPDPLDPGHIPGQNPNTPQRLPGHTAWYRRRPQSPAAWFVFVISAMAIVAYVLLLSGAISSDF